MDENRGETTAEAAESQDLEKIVPEKKVYEGFKFSVLMTERDMKHFVLYHNYSSFQGWIGIIISAAALIYLVVGFADMNWTTRVVFLIIGLLFTVVNPLMLCVKARQQVRKNPTFQTPLDYILADEALVIEQDEAQAAIPWGELRLIKETKYILIVYVTKMRAFIWPKDQLDSQYREITDILRQKMDASRLRLKSK